MKFSTDLHSFHIPVMGLAFTIDTPVKVARFGISSVISIVQDNLIEKMRSYYYAHLGEVYNPITADEEDFRAKRITDYLNLVNRMVSNQMDVLRNSEFGEGMEIDKYFEMLPEDSQVKDTYLRMQRTVDSGERRALQNQLRAQMRPGSIDVNIMTKLDKPNFGEDGRLVENGSDAVAALRGYANSDLTDSSVILSAGMNPPLFGYMETLNAFDADSRGDFWKKIVVKVSDYRSALVQGKMLAKKGLWVSEFRIESGLNCGGHAFATDGYLMGPILEEFKSKKTELITTLFDTYNEALKAKSKPSFARPHPLMISAQGGIGTHAEDELLLRHYGIDRTGWGTPFLLVPEATTVDDHTLHLLSEATEQDVVLSRNSPLGIRFHYLKGTTGEQEKLSRIARGKPGSPCTEKYLVSNTEFTEEPICTASRAYQKKKIAELDSLNLSHYEYERQKQEVLDKECLCVGLSNAAVNHYQLAPFKNLEARTICPGPNIAYFKEVLSLKQMIDHIYGRADVLRQGERTHMFIKELSLYIDYWKELLEEERSIIDSKKNLYIQKFYTNLIDGIAYYRDLSGRLSDDFKELGNNLEKGLDEAQALLTELFQLKLVQASHNMGYRE